MHKLVEQNLLLFETEKVENILAQNFVLFLCFIFFVRTNSSLSLREFSFIYFVFDKYKRSKKVNMKFVLFSLYKWQFNLENH